MAGSFAVCFILLFSGVYGLEREPCPPKCSQVTCDSLENSTEYLYAHIEDLKDENENLTEKVCNLTDDFTKLLECFNELDQAVRCWMGMKSGGISDDMITASSHLTNFPPHRARLDTIRGRGTTLRSGWRPGGSDTDPYIQVDFGEVKAVAGVITQGRSDADHRVEEYRVECGDGMMGFADVISESSGTTTFVGNTDRDSYVYNRFNGVEMCQIIRIFPIGKGNLCMRFELVRGKCYEEYTEYIVVPEPLPI